MNIQRLAIIMSALVGMACTFLPWATVPVLGSVNGISGGMKHGWLTFALFLIPLIIVFLGNLKSSVKTGGLVLTCLLGLTAAGYALYQIWQFKSKYSAEANNNMAQIFGSTMTLGIGLYLIVAAGLGVFLLGLILKTAAPSIVKSSQPVMNSNLNNA